MNIAVIGGGITGLTAAYELCKLRHKVTVFEKEPDLGGLASSFKSKGWNWSLERSYHHFFTNDHALISLAKELGLKHDMITFRQVTATLIQNNKEDAVSEKFFADRFPSLTSQRNELRRDEKTIKTIYSRTTIASSGARKIFYEQQHPHHNIIFQLDSLVSLLTFPLLSPFDKFRTATLLAFCKLNPFWQPLEKVTTEKFFQTLGGTRAWKMLWEPLMMGKFGKYANKIPASWLWARFHKRTMKLGYFKGGFQTLIDALERAIVKQDGVIKTNYQITNINPSAEGQKNFKPARRQGGFQISNFKFDKVLLTVPSPVAAKLLSQLSTNNRAIEQYNNVLLSIPHLWAQTLILETKEPILNTTYWLNIADPSFPFVAVVTHTNMINKKNYGGHHLTYIGNYLPDDHPFLTMNKQQLLKIVLPYLKKINPSVLLSSRLVVSSSLFTEPSAQPIHTLNYSKKTPSFQTPIKGVYLANLDSIYPWDRGINYAVELGKRAAGIIYNI